MSLPRPDIILVNPPLLWGQEDRMDIKPPLNLLYLASWLNHCGHVAEVIDVISETLSRESLLERLLHKRPRFLGIPFYQSTFRTSLELCRLAKAQDPTLITVGGGPMMTTSSQVLLAEKDLDVGIIGEGEETLQALLVHPPADWPSLPGIAWKEGKTVRENSRPAPLANLDVLPFLDFSLIPLEKYFQFQDRLKMPRWLFLCTSRGCTFRCSFCATPQLWPGHMRRCSVPRVIDEIRFQLRRYPSAGIGFMDDSFFSDKQWLRDFLTAVEPLKIRYCCIGRADHLEAPEIERLAATGCHYVALGVETGDQARQKTIHKYLNLDKVKRNVEFLARAGIITKCFFMLGFPDETLAEMLATVNFAVACRRLGMHECNFFPVSIYPGTELAKGLKEDWFRSSIYEDFDRQNRPVDELTPEEDRGEKRLSIYAGIPDVTINQHLSRDGLLELIKLSYNKVEAREDLRPEELESLRRRFPSPLSAESARKNSR